MGNLTLKGSTSGQVTISPPAVAGTTTLTLPATSGTVVVSSTGALPGISRQYSNLNITASASSVALTANAVTISTSGGTLISLTSVNIPTISISTTGANALDTGTLAADTFYAVYVIYNANTSTTAGLLSTSATTPTLPSGYTYYARFGWVYATSTSALLPTIQYNTSAEYITPRVAVNAVSPGAAFTQVNLMSGATKFLPTTASQVSANITQASGTSRAYIYKNNAGTIVTSAWLYINTGSTALFPLVMPFKFVLQSDSFYYSTNGGTATINIGGWEDNL